MLGEPRTPGSIKRFFALFFDFLPQGFVLGAVMAVGMSDSLFTRALLTWQDLGLFLLATVGTYFVTLMVLGNSLGKLLFRIEIIGEDGQAIKSKPMAALIRSFGMVFAYYSGAIFLLAASSFLSPVRRHLVDTLAGTRVIDLGDKSDITRPRRFIVMVPVLFIGLSATVGTLYSFVIQPDFEVTAEGLQVNDPMVKVALLSAGQGMNVAKMASGQSPMSKEDLAKALESGMKDEKLSQLMEKAKEQSKELKALTKQLSQENNAKGQQKPLQLQDKQKVENLLKKGALTNEALPLALKTHDPQLITRVLQANPEVPNPCPACFKNLVQVPNYKIYRYVAYHLRNHGILNEGDYLQAIQQMAEFDWSNGEEAKAYAEMLDDMLAQEVDINTLTSEGRLLLEGAIKTYNTSILRYAVSRGLDLNQQSAQGETYLELLAQQAKNQRDQRAKGMFKTLIALGAKMDAPGSQGSGAEARSIASPEK